MKKQTLTKEYVTSLTPFQVGEFSIICLTKDREIVKIFKPELLAVYKIVNIDIESKLLNDTHYYISDEIVKPNTVFYSKGGEVVGYKTSHTLGINLNKFEMTLSSKDLLDLSLFNEIHKQLENIVKKNKDIVFPDLCSCDNIHISRSNDNIKLIDYDGMQIGHHKSVNISTTLQEGRNDYYIPKYFQNNLFTKNLDKKSLIDYNTFKVHTK